MDQREDVPSTSTGAVPSENAVKSEQAGLFLQVESPKVTHQNVCDLEMHKNG